MAETQNVPQVALEAGNSPRMIFQHYRELVQRKEAKQWFAIAPKGGTRRRKVMSKKAQVAKQTARIETAVKAANVVPLPVAAVA